VLLEHSADGEVRRVREDCEKCVGLRVREQGRSSKGVVTLFERRDGSWSPVDGRGLPRSPAAGS
jgi:hypothetical protein